MDIAKMVWKFWRALPDNV